MAIITLDQYKELGSKGPQFIFDFVIDHLLEQKQVSRSDGYCTYRGPGGTACAVGCLIPSEIYRSTMEQKSIRDVLGMLYSFNILDTHKVLSDNDTLLDDLQNFHDRYFTKITTRVNMSYYQILLIRMTYT